VGRGSQRVSVHVRGVVVGNVSGLSSQRQEKERLAAGLPKGGEALRVNAFSPGVGDSLRRSDRPAGMFQAARRSALVARPGRIGEAAEATAFLVDDRFAAAVALDVDGGGRLT